MANRSLAHSALEYTRLGWAVTPIKQGTKHIRNSAYLSEAWGPEQVERWWRDHPEDNIALVPALSGLVVVDLDSYKPKFSYERLKLLNLDTRTLCACTPQGGTHWIYKAGNLSFRRSNPNLPCIDVIYNGCVTLPPSRIEGRPHPYTWKDGFKAIRAVPEGVITHYAISTLQSSIIRATSQPVDHSRDYIALLAQSPNNVDDYYDWLKICFALHYQYAGTSWEDQAREAFVDWSLRWEAGEDTDHLYTKACATWDSARSREELEAYSQKPVTPGSILYILKEWSSLPDRAEYIPRQPDKEPAPTPPEEPPAQDCLQSVEANPLALPMPRPWVFGKFLLRNTITTLIAAGGVGKSTLITAWAMSMASGVEFLNVVIPQRPQKVFVWHGEEPLEEFARRYHAVKLIYSALKLDDSPLDKNLYLKTSEEYAFHLVVSEGKGKVQVCSATRDKLIKDSLDAGIDVIIVDSFMLIHRVVENDSDSMKVVMDTLNYIARNANVAICLIHHTRKEGESKADDERAADTARGSSTIINQSRTVLKIVPMSSCQAEEYAIDKTERFRYIRVVHGKANYIARDEALQWYFLNSVRLGNATGATPADNIAVAQPWVPPTAEDSTPPSPEPTSTAQAATSSKRPQWIGHTIAEQLGWDIGTSDSVIQLTLIQSDKRRKLKRLIVSLEAEGYLSKVASADSGGEFITYRLEEGWLPRLHALLKLRT